MNDNLRHTVSPHNLNARVLKSLIGEPAVFLTNISTECDEPCYKSELLKEQRLTVIII